ncbi:hypothetical protein K431DRAFT_296351 [Polychaeton citri CBS 116435]|uniref:Rrn9 domain-containing protein n=1 Tax=Polychaeton citri CBS 116435 TaxID=1314669 RepID=A0A9P4Q3X1_9PEZI|nr:hypothetical protein K431DRAFT_296351 [Polychaeton citri CBS 116435]
MAEEDESVVSRYVNQGNMAAVAFVHRNSAGGSVSASERIDAQADESNASVEAGTKSAASNEESTESNRSEAESSVHEIPTPWGQEVLRRTSAEQARAKKLRSFKPEIDGDDYPQVQTDTRSWVKRIKRAIKSYQGNLPPPHKGRGEVGRELTEKDKEEWERWQNDSQWNSDQILNLPTGDQEAEDVAWIVVDEVIKSHIHGFFESTVEPDLEVKASARLLQIEDIIEGYAIARFNLLEVHVKSQEMWQLIANPTEWAKRKSANVWTNLEKVRADTKRNQKRPGTVPQFLKRRLTTKQLVKKWKAKTLTEDDFSEYLSCGEDGEATRKKSKGGYKAKYIVEDGKLIDSFSDISSDDGDPGAGAVEYELDENGIAIVEEDEEEEDEVVEEDEDEDEEGAGEDAGDEEVDA